MREFLEKSAEFAKYILLAVLFPAVYTAVNLLVTIVAMAAMLFGEVFAGMSPEELQKFDINSLNQTELAETAQSLINRNIHAVLIFSALLTLLILLLVFRSRGALSERVKMTPVSVKTAGMSALCGMSFYFLIVLTMGLLVASSPELRSLSDEYSKLMEPLVNKSAALEVFSLVIMAPVVEEVIFRGLSYNYLKRIMPVWAAVVLQSVIFSFAHMDSYQVIYVLMLAPVLALLYEWTGSLYAPILAHMAFNAMSTVISRLSDQAAESYLRYGLILAAPAAVFTLAYFSRNRMRAEKR